MYDSYHSYTHITTMFSYVRNMFVLVPTPLTHILQSVSNYGFKLYVDRRPQGLRPGLEAGAGYNTKWRRSHTQALRPWP